MFSSFATPSARRVLPRILGGLSGLCLAAVVGGGAQASPIGFLDEAAYLSALSLLGERTIQEGFEADTVWGGVRSSTLDGFNTAPSILSQGVRWTSNAAASAVTTSGGAALSGDWGLFSFPHGDFAGPDHTDDTPDGFAGSSTASLFGVGGWVRTNTPFAALSVFIDGTKVDFGNLPGGGDSDVLGTTARFFGVIETAGFGSFLFQETEGTFDDQKFIFADDFTIAGSGLGGGNGTGTVATVPLPASMTLYLFALMGFAATMMRQTGWIRPLRSRT
ncbi:hypothetical protein EOI86_12100 [Hwanghaeella grinnelliae]|uniref:Uncharacterized protein n=1 Tax=Hwanghaeella grinnelliae TaxID=2500179 RepID=A0A3S2WR95_9PROT|nr:hypothetical protein [Hwanghaeella grinnelliae]RVU35985.1 hypothetical protein EOI86_12100 [Hwanghaeella grinnelliae]